MYIKLLTKAKAGMNTVGHRGIQGGGGGGGGGTGEYIPSFHWANIVGGKVLL